jgi:PAS domain S-box-containing protein
MNNKPPIQHKKKRKTEPTLRKRAERKLASTRKKKAASSTDAFKLVHELQVHQLELEMQNEELQSAKTAVEESRARFSDLYDFAPIGYMTLDDKGTVVEANLTSARLLSLDREKLLHKPFHSFVFPADHDVFSAHFKRVLSTDPKTTFELRLVKGDGTIFYGQIDSIGFENKSKSVPQFLLAISDITDRIKAENLLRIQSHDLAVANKELEAFSFSVSHDLRNPLNSIAVCLAVINDDLETTMGKDSKEAIGHIVKTAHGMLQVITDLLALSSITQQEVHRETTNLSDMVRSSYGELKSSSPDREVEFVIAPDCITNADAGLARILIEHLVRNAWKFTSTTVRAHIEFGSQSGNGQTAYFIEDNGVGFDMADVGKLFKPFMRLHIEKEFKGTGIGLAIVKRIIEKHHGTIRVEAEKDKGATFYFRLE